MKKQFLVLDQENINYLNQNNIELKNYIRKLKPTMANFYKGDILSKTDFLFLMGSLFLIDRLFLQDNILTSCLFFLGFILITELNKKKILKKYDEDHARLIAANQKIRITTKVTEYQGKNIQLLDCSLVLYHELPEGLIEVGKEVIIDMVNYKSDIKTGHIICIRVINPSNELFIKSFEEGKIISCSFSLFFGPYVKLFE
jgi:hypothetical protein